MTRVSLTRGLTNDNRSYPNVITTSSRDMVFPISNTLISITSLLGCKNVVDNAGELSLRR